LAGWLQFVFRADREKRSASYAAEGNRLMAAGRYEEAADQFREAVSLSHSADDRLALGSALASAGHTEEAAMYLNGALAAQPRSGPANLAMARLTAQQGQIDGAVTYFQHAIYGAWPAGNKDGPWQARMDLVKALLGAGRKEQARAELLSALPAAQNNASRKQQAAAMLVNSGFAADAIAAFRELRQKQPGNLAISDGLADAEFAAGDYQGAREDYGASLELQPDDEQARRRLALCGQVLALDPTFPHLAAVARYMRARVLLTAVLDDLQRCGEGGLNTQAARDQLARTRPPHYADAAESALAEAEQLWQNRPPSCERTGDDDAVGLVMKKLSRR
jgi:tetratricopeptide (TPR) repeat protein